MRMRAYQALQLFLIDGTHWRRLECDSLLGFGSEITAGLNDAKGKLELVTS